MLSAQEKKRRLESILSRVKTNRGQLDAKLGVAASMDDAIAGKVASAVKSPETPTVVSKQPTPPPPKPRESKPIRLSSWPPPPTMKSKPSPAAHEAPAEPEPLLPPRISMMDTLEPASPISDTLAPDAAASEEAMASEPITADPETAIMRAIPEDVMAAAELEEAAEAGRKAGVARKPADALLSEEAKSEPPSTEVVFEAVATATPEQPKAATVAGTKAAAPSVAASEVEVRTFAPKLRTDVSAISVKGTAEVDWSLKGVLERAWQLGLPKPHS